MNLSCKRKYCLFKSVKIAFYLLVAPHGWVRLVHFGALLFVHTLNYFEYTIPPPSRHKNLGGDILGTKRGIRDPLMSKRQKKTKLKKTNSDSLEVVVVITEWTRSLTMT